MYSYDIVIFNRKGKFTRTIEHSSLNLNEFSTSKLNEGYAYNLILGHIFLLSKYQINVKIQNVLKLKELNSEIWKYEKNIYGEYWNTY
jgi:hypothetical protein